MQGEPTERPRDSDEARTKQGEREVVLERHLGPPKRILSLGPFAHNFRSAAIWSLSV